MSEQPSLVTAEHFRYIAERTAPEDPFLSRLKEDARAAGIPPIWIGPAQGSFMQILLKLRGARDVVEVGTLAGYSAIWMARALPRGGRVRTIEIDERFADFAEDRIARSDVRGHIDVLRGDAKEVLKAIRPRSADAMFLDADKAGYPTYLEQSVRILRPRGLLMVDNAFAFGELFAQQPKDRETEAVRRFNEIMAREKRFHSLIVPIGDGMWVAVKKYSEVRSEKREERG